MCRLGAIQALGHFQDPRAAVALREVFEQTVKLPFTQDFNSLALTGTSSTLPTGWAMAESGTNANATYTASTGSLNSGDTYSYGATSTISSRAR